MKGECITMARTAALKVYHIYVNGTFISNSMGESTTQAIAMFARERGIKTGRSVKIGTCGNAFSGCTRRGQNMCYPCGALQKCSGRSIVTSDAGNITAVCVG